MSNFRIEHDFLGEMKIPDNVYYGIQTMRAVENFHITNIPISTVPALIRAFAYVKKAAAQANAALHVMPEEIADAIGKACDAIADGELIDQFPVDLIQGGAGTSTNMNANEVIANKALEILGLEKGRYDVVHPNNHVNFSQSTNDAYPTAFRLALYLNISEINVKNNGDFVFYTSEFGIPVVLGRTQVGTRLVKFDVFWKSVVASQGAHELLYIDLRFEDQVVVRWNHDNGDDHS